MKRHPQYAQGNDAYRITSGPNETWRLEKFSQRDGTKTFDPWEPQGPWTTFALAYRRLMTFNTRPNGTPV